jgi:1,4-alpha-glucan branching enzyme
MALAKQFLKSKPLVKVSFELSPENFNGKEVAVLGDFNNWNPKETLLKKQKNGNYKTTLEFPVGTEIQFRYLIDGEYWLTDQTADKFISTGVSEDQNAVVVL